MAANGSTTFNVKASVSDNPIRWLVAGGGLLVAAIAIGATVMVGNFRERALDNSKRELENTVLLLSRHFDQQLEDFGAVQNDLIAYMRSNGIDSVEHYKRRMSSPDIHLMLRAKLSALSYVGGINVFDSDGVLINSSSAWPVPPISVADRPYFKTFKNDPQSPDMLIEPVYSRITGALDHRDRAQDHRTARRIPRRHRQGHRTRQFRKILRQRGARRWRRDRHVPSRRHAARPLSPLDSMIGQNFADGPFFQSILSKSDHGTCVRSVPSTEKTGWVRLAR